MFRPFKTLAVLLTLLSLLLGSAVVVTPVRAAGECYVKADAGGADDGTSWADAYTDLQLALGTSPCTEIWVAAGTYKPTMGTDRNATFQLKSGVALYGGFAGTEMARNQRNPVTNVTILSGDIDNNDSQTPIITDITTVTGNTTNSYHVVTSTDIATAVLDGFTITAGKTTDGNYVNSTDSGAGMFNRDSSLVLTNITFYGNSGSVGGGLYNRGGNPTFTNVTFIGNSGAWGGGIFNDYSLSTLMNMTFTGNTSQNGGGGIYNRYSSPTLVNMTFTGNTDPWGGGIFNIESHPIVKNSILWGNGGSEIYNYTNSATEISDSVVPGGYVGGTNIITTDPMLGTLGNYGGYTQTIPLLVGSSAINTGNNATCAANDQRGVARPQGSACDIGSYEYNYTGVYYVKPVASGTGDCQSWANACTLQTALNTATIGDEIWVAAGMYKPASGTDRTATFQLKSGVKLYGGFPATGAPGFADRDPATNNTVLSGDLNGDDGTDFANYSDNSDHVVTGHYTDSNTLLDGFTIRGGYATSPGEEYGGGFTAYAANLTISNVIFAQNYSAFWGGGLYVNNGSLTLEHVTFTGNQAVSGGGMMLNRNAHTLTDVTFKNNVATSNGGGIYTFNASSPTLTNVIFDSNSAASGGGIGNENGIVTVTGSTFSNNTADNYGGGIDNGGGILSVTNSTFSNNTATHWNGGGIASNNQLTVTNSTFVGNSALGSSDGAGGGIGSSGAVSVTNSTFSGNKALKGGGLSTNGTVSIDNSTFSGNEAVNTGGGVWNYSGTLSLYNTIVANSPSGGNCYGTITDGGGNLVWGDTTTCPGINADPKLGPLNNNSGPTQTMELLAGSPAIDAGNDAVCPTTDQRGIGRPVGAHCDIGAYEKNDVTITVTINQAMGQPDPTEDTATEINFTAIFSQSVTGFGAQKTDVSLSGTAGATTVKVTGNGTTYNIAVSGMIKHGTVIARIPTGAAQDAAGNKNLSSTSTDNQVTFGIPPVKFTKKPPSIADNSSPTFEFNYDRTGKVNYLCKMDYEPGFYKCTSPWTVKNVPDKMHTFFVCGYGEPVCVNNQTDKLSSDTATHKSYTWYTHAVDYAAPTATIVSDSGRLWTNQARIKFRVTFSEPVQAFNRTMVQVTGTAEPYIVGYISYNNNAYSFLVAPKKNGTIKITILTGKVKDLAGNLMQTSFASPTVHFEQIQPKDVIIRYKPDVLSTEAQAIFKFKTNELSNFYCRLDAAPETKCSSAPLSMQGVWIGTVSDGSHTFSVRAVDRAGNRSAKNTVYSWTVDARPPVITIFDPPANPTNQQTATFIFKVVDGLGNGVASIQCRLDIVPLADCESPKNYSSLVNGFHTFEISARDNVGHVSSVLYTWLVDSTAPEVTIPDPAWAILLPGPQGSEWWSNSTEAAFEFSVNETGSGVASIQCQLNGGGFANCASPQTYPGLSEGSHTFQASVTDNAGNVATTEIYSWSVDTTPPEIIIDTSTGLSVAVSDTGGSGVQYIYCGAYDNNNNGWNGSGTQCTDPNILANMKLPAGSYTFYVSAYDMVWNSNYQAVPLTIP